MHECARAGALHEVRGLAAQERRCGRGTVRAEVGGVQAEVGLRSEQRKPKTWNNC